MKSICVESTKESITLLRLDTNILGMILKYTLIRFIKRKAKMQLVLSILEISAILVQLSFSKFVVLW